jgi:hypothetical protein
MEIILRREFGNSVEEDENSLIYRAPEVLLGFTESESSYIWTIGLLIDEIYHDRLFYRKINEILSHKSNPQFMQTTTTAVPSPHFVPSSKPCCARTRRRGPHLPQPASNSSLSSPDFQSLLCDCGDAVTVGY